MEENRRLAKDFRAIEEDAEGDSIKGQERVAGWMEHKQDIIHTILHNSTPIH